MDIEGAPCSSYSCSNKHKSYSNRLIVFKNNEHILPAASFFHSPQLFCLVVDALGQVSVMSDAADLRVVLELLLQLLTVVGSLPLSGGQLIYTREEDVT